MVGIFRSLSAKLFGVCSAPVGASSSSSVIISPGEITPEKHIDKTEEERLILPAYRYKKIVTSLRAELGNLTEIIPGRFYLGCSSFNRGLKTPGVTVFTLDDCVLYEPFHKDFGPLNLAAVHRYSLGVYHHLKSQPTEGIMVHLVSGDPKHRANAAFLAGAFCIVVLKWSLTKVLDNWLSQMLPTLLPYRDAAYGPCTFKLSVADCLDGLYKGVSLGWYDFKSFDLAKYEIYDKLENGDLHWVIPNEFIAFSGPEDNHPPLHMVSLSTAEYANLFHSMGIKLVIRLNKEQYDRRVFLAKGINHEDLYFPDGSCPPLDILNRFLYLAENHQKPIAVHCKAGLGRTGTLLGCYAIKSYGFTARQWIGWNRITRPGSVLGPQQQFLCDIENELLRRDDGETPASLLKTSTSSLALTPQAADMGQGQRLMSSRLKHAAAAADKKQL